MSVVLRAAEVICQRSRERVCLLRNCAARIVAAQRRMRLSFLKFRVALSPKTDSYALRRRAYCLPCTRATSK